MKKKKKKKPRVLVRNRRGLVLPSNSLGVGRGGLRTSQVFLPAYQCREDAGLGLRACLVLTFLGGFKAYASGIK